MVPLVWSGFVLLLEPLNYRRGRPSWLAALAVGDASLVLALLASGALCGVLWEFWNYWALTRWTYSVPYVSHLKVFEMPALGYLGFPPFALECYAMYHWLRGAPGDGGPDAHGAIIRSHAVVPPREEDLHEGDPRSRCRRSRGSQALTTSRSRRPRPARRSSRSTPPGLNYIDVYFRTGMYKAECRSRSAWRPAAPSPPSAPT